MREVLFLRKSGTELNLKGHKEQMVGYGGEEKSRTAEFSNLQFQINRNILEFSLTNFQQQLNFNFCGNINEGCDRYIMTKVKL